MSLSFSIFAENKKSGVKLRFVSLTSGQLDYLNCGLLSCGPCDNYDHELEKFGDIAQNQ